MTGNSSRSLAGYSFRPVSIQSLENGGFPVYIAFGAPMDARQINPVRVWQSCFEQLSSADDEGLFHPSRFRQPAGSDQRLFQRSRAEKVRVQG